MMFVEAIVADVVLRGLVLTAIAMCWVVALVRLVGLRSFSKMTNFDFVMTIAVGSLLAGAGQSSEWTQFLQSLAGMTAMFLVQWITALSRRHSQRFDRLISNQPLILMRNGAVIEPALEESRVSLDDLYAKLREANVLELADMRAVVLETTGDISVLNGDNLQDQLLLGTRTV